jgi:hypothetical protein
MSKNRTELERELRRLHSIKSPDAATKREIERLRRLLREISTPDSNGKGPHKEDSIWQR